MTKEQQNNTLISEIPEISYLSNKILEKINEDGLTVAKFAEQLNIGGNTLRRMIQASEQYAPNISNLKPLARVFNCSIAQLLMEEYPIHINSYSSLENLANNDTDGIKTIMVSKGTYLKNKYAEFIHIRYYMDLHAVFSLKQEFPKAKDSFGAIILLNNKLQFGYFQTNHKQIIFNNFTDMTKQIVNLESIKLIAIKEDSSLV